eukprot:4327823-Alexandrium_andersonii.AAC.1
MPRRGPLYGSQFGVALLLIYRTGRGVGAKQGGGCASGWASGGVAVDWQHVAPCVRAMVASKSSLAK